MNISGTLNVFRLITQPSLCLPHATISTFNELPIPLSKAFTKGNDGKDADIRAVVLDKDNCFAVPHANEVYKPYHDRFEALKAAYPSSRLLIVSNTAGTATDRDFEEARLLERNTGVKVLRHNTKKPGCHLEILSHFQADKDTGVTSPSQIAVVGDRLFTDVMTANMMGARGIWIKDGIVEEKSIFAKVEHSLAGFLQRRGYSAPDPKSDFE
ncbi:HAD-superfamily phosphatase [Pseudovirgaria hyperparasitica]|uniref:HAD-superfamily phosphatase n=1 Tax=Pseudovirgaria hyperparasitica TaxID=470096 RepID=A0A6A6WKD5_9PEZI|nr:HAD-superfamily phosphatase [Pseudovirgaria hyperparasitica]KAF2762616.1 HAD-superfamily phosphatase [Pseudovirgaria hyperparasitica]